MRPADLLASTEGARVLAGLGPGADAFRGVHLNTFNQVRNTERWRRRALDTWGSYRGDRQEGGYAS